MAKKKPLLPAQQAEIKRMYQQLDDKDLAKLVGSDPKTVKEFRKSNHLIRSPYTEEKLNLKNKGNGIITMDEKGGEEATEVVSSNID